MLDGQKNGLYSDHRDHDSDPIRHGEENGKLGK